MTRPGAALFLLFALSIGEHEEVLGQGRGPGLQLSRQEMLEVIQQRFQARAAREMQLDEDQSEALREVFETFRDARAELQPRRRELNQEIRQLMSGNGSEDRAMELIQELREIRQEEAALLIEEEEQLLETLSPSQLLRFQLMRDQFGQQIRRLGSPDNRNGLGPGRQGGGFRGPPGG